ncbi:14005_t:CDS:2 [Entrophospora sp. SA101]|nr:14005_t:CDS:2 [Entrophospora sp. SA101]
MISNKEENDLELTTPAKINLIMKLLRSSPAVEQYFDEFRNFFADDKRPEDLNRVIENLGQEIINLKDHIKSLKKKIV